MKNIRDVYLVYYYYGDSLRGVSGHFVPVQDDEKKSVSAPKAANKSLPTSTSNAEHTPLPLSASEKTEKRSGGAFARVMTVLMFLLFAVGACLPYYYSLTGGVTAGSLLTGGQTVLQMLLAAFESGISFLSVAYNVYPWTVAAITALWLLLTLVNFKAKKPLNGLMFGSFFSLHGVYSYYKMAGLQLDLASVRGVDVLAVAFVLSAIVLVAVLFHLMISQFSNQKGLIIGALFGLALSAAALVTVVLQPEVDVLLSLKKTAVLLGSFANLCNKPDCSWAEFAFAVMLCALYLNGLFEYMRVVARKKATVATVFRYLILTAASGAVVFLCYKDGEFLTPATYVAGFLAAGVVTNVVAIFLQKPKKAKKKKKK